MEKFAIAVKSFIVKDNKLLILRRSLDAPHKPGAWDIPGGRLDVGENPYAGLKRETLEETGIDIEVLHPLNIHHFVRDDGQQITMLIFLCQPLEEPIKISAEHSEYSWEPINSCHEKITWLNEEIKRFNQLHRN